MYDFHITIRHISDTDLTTAELTDDTGNVVTRKAWLDKKYPKSKEELGNIITEVTEEMFPKNQEEKTTRGRKKNETDI